MLESHPNYSDHNRLAFRAVSKDRSKQGFTLFEVSISLVLVAFGVISVMTLFPIGIKAEQMARMRLYAAVKAGEIIESFSTQSNENPAIDVEAPFQWEVPSGHRPFCPDLEARVATSRYGIMPVPLEIALRLESENDEIRKILSEGGQLFYSKATGASGYNEAVEGKVTTPTDPLTQRLVFAVNGHAQNNSVSYLAQKTWPYHTPYPSPPLFGLKEGFRNVDAPSNPPMSTDASFVRNNLKFSLWEGVTGGVPLQPTIGRGESAPGTGSLDPDTRLVFACGYRPYAFDRLCDAVSQPPPATPSLSEADAQLHLDEPASSLEGKKIPLYFRRQQGAERYIQMALWYCDKKGLGIDYTTLSGPNALNPVVAAKFQAANFRSLVPDVDKWKYVQAMRFLSHAATCITAWTRSDGLNSTTTTHIAGTHTPVEPRTGITIPAMTITTIATATLPAQTITMPAKLLKNEDFVYYHELCMLLVMSYSASQPYDWGAPRPTQRAIFTDYPLVEYDLIQTASNPATGTIEGTSGVSAQQWKPIPASPIKNIGRSASFPNVPIPDTTWGDPNNFTLTKKFEPAERCRQLVFWAADWMSYIDCESAPSAPIDGSRYLFSAPFRSNGSTLVFDKGTSMVSLGDRQNGTPPDDRMVASPWFDHLNYAFGNPEKATLFTGRIDDKPTGYDLANSPPLNGWTSRGGAFDQGSHWERKNVFLGVYGGDRNFNNKLDRGLIPKSVRMRATFVARYNFYDPRLVLRLR